MLTFVWIRENFIAKNKEKNGKGKKKKGEGERVRKIVTRSMQRKKEMKIYNKNIQE